MIDPLNIKIVQIFNFSLFQSEVSKSSNSKNDHFWSKFFVTKPKKKLLIKFLMVQGVYWIFCGQIRAKKFSPFQRSGPLVFNFCQNSCTPPFEKWKKFFVQFEKKWHFWNQLAKPISEMSFFSKSDEKNFQNFSNEHKDPGLWFLSKVQNQRSGPLKWGKFFVSDLAAKNSVDSLNHKKFDELLFFGFWDKKFWPKMAIFWIWAISDFWLKKWKIKKLDFLDF